MKPRASLKYFVNNCRFDTSSYKLDRPLPIVKCKKSNWINEKWIRWKNHEQIYWIKSKNL